MHMNHTLTNSGSSEFRSTLGMLKMMECKILQNLQVIVVVAAAAADGV